MSRGKATLFIHIFVAVQLLLPLSYYTLRTDRNDERFAWRMFSVDRATTCEVTFKEGASRKQVSVGTRFHEAWRTVARRGRRGVIERMAESICSSQEQNAEVYVTARCKPLKGMTRLIASGDKNFCEHGELR